MSQRDDDEDEHELFQYDQNDADLKPATKGSLIALYKFITTIRLLVLFPALLCSILAGLIPPALAVFFGRVFDAFTGYAGGNLSSEQLLSRSLVNTYGLVVIGLATWITQGCFFALWVVCGGIQAKRVRNRLFEALLRKDLEWYETRSQGVGSLLVRLQTQIYQLQISSSQPMGFVCTCSVQAMASMVVAFYYNWELTLVMLGAAPVMISIFSSVQRIIPGTLLAYSAAQNSATRASYHILKDISIIKCSNTQTFEATRYRQSIDLATSLYLKQLFVNCLEIGISRFGSAAVMVGAMYLGVVLVHQSKSTAQSIITSFWSCLATMKAIEDIIPYLMTYERGRIAAIALQNVLDYVNRIQQPAKADAEVCATEIEGKIEVRNVSFSYPSCPDRFILNNANFLFPAGKITFLVGKSGSGKSTIGNLLLRFYEPVSGAILVDDQGIKNMSISWLRNNVTLVEQQNTLFNETIFRNVAFGHQNSEQTTYSQVYQCLEFALLSKMVDGLPDGLNTKLNMNGGTMSGGQKQRITIARAKLRDTPVLILDEPTSALDYNTRTLVMRNIRSWRRGKTTIIVTHDLSQIGDDDLFYILGDEDDSIEGFSEGMPTSLTEAYCRDICAVEDDVARPLQLQTHMLPTTIGITGFHQSPSFEDRSDTHASIYRILDAFEQTSLRISIYSDHLTSLSVSKVLDYRLSLGGRNRSIDQKYPMHQDAARLTRPRAVLDNRDCCKSRLSRWTSMEPDHFSVSELRPLQRGNGRLLPNTPQQNATMSKVQPMASTHATQSSQSLRVDPEFNPLPLQRIFMTVWPTVSLREKIMLLTGILAATVHAACTPLFSFFLSKLLTVLPLQTNWHEQAQSFSLILLGITVADGISSFLFHYWLDAVGQSWVDQIRLKAVQRIITQPKEWFDDPSNEASQVCSMLDRHADEMRNLLGRFAAPLYIVVVMITSSLAWALTQCWQLTFVGILSAPILYGITKGFNKVCSYWETRASAGIDSINAIFVETFTNIRTVRALTLESWFHQKYTKATSQTFNLDLKRGIYSGSLYGLVDGAVYLVTAAILGYGAVLVTSGTYSVETMLAVISLLLFSSASANAIVNYIPQITSSINAATHLLHLSLLPSLSHEDIGHFKLDFSDLNTLSGPIEFRNHTFTYPSRPEATVLRNISFTIPPGKCTAIIGASGSGKSTVASLLLGLYPSAPTISSSTHRSLPTILLSGHDLRTLEIHSLRNGIATVPQPPVIIPGTIRENILYGAPPSRIPSDSRLETAARAAAIHDFITTLPSGYDTIIGDGGLGVSGGQAQRIAIARALARSPRILILDEATSALDHETANIVMTNIERLIDAGRQGRSNVSLPTASPPLTVIMITHVKEMMQRADHVVVLKDGCVVEEGRYRDLISCRGELWELLGAGERDGVGSSSRVMER